MPASKEEGIHSSLLRF